MEFIPSIIWTLLIVVFLFIEFSTVQFISIWFAFGALCATLVSLFIPSTIFQIFTFLIASLLSLLLTRKFAMKFLNLKNTATNTDRIIGMTGKVEQDIIVEDNVGRVMVNGLSWKADSQNQQDIPQGTSVTVLSIQGVTITVIPVSVG